MPRGGANNVRTHTCSDGQVRRIYPVYFREERVFKRESWFCYYCRYADGQWEPEEKAELG